VFYQTAKLPLFFELTKGFWIKMYGEHNFYFFSYSPPYFMHKRAGVWGIFSIFALVFGIMNPNQLFL
jgi:hypothetical protein